MKLFNKFLVISAFALPSFVSAASSAQTLQIHVPFSFMVGDQQFAAGDYRVQQSDTGLIYVLGEGKGAATLSIPGDAKAGTPTSLRFSASQQHSLVGIEIAGESSRLIPVEESRKLSLAPAR